MLAERVAQHCGLTRDGGVLNPGRRGGMGTVMLNAVCHPEQGSQRLFDHYFQAVGSGSGAIAAWEAVQLLLADGRFGDIATRIHVAQNEPFVPIVRAWREGVRELHSIPENEAHAQISAVSAMVLTNRKPPYSLAGGLRDVLRHSKGTAWRFQTKACSTPHACFIPSKVLTSDPLPPLRSMHYVKPSHRCGEAARLRPLACHRRWSRIAIFRRQVFSSAAFAPRKAR